MWNNKMLKMEKYILEKDIKVFYITATSFPNGVGDAHNALRNKLPLSMGRSFYAISYSDEKGKITYKAAVEESYEGEAEKLGCETFIIKKGEFISETLKDWRENELNVGKTFQKLLAHPAIQENGYCLEIYLNNDKDIQCLVTLN
jgi:predicted transcriptional regulator YdeE